jgi:hypothetical protein
MQVKKKQDSMWEDIKDTPNTDEGIIEKISLLAPMLSYISSVNTMEIYKNKDKSSMDSVKEKDFDSVFIEVLILEMFIIDSIFSFANLKNKSKYRNVLFQETVSVLELVISERELTSHFDSEEFSNKLNKRVREYSRLNKAKDINDLMSQEFFESFRTKIGDILILHKNNSILIDFEKEIIKSIKALQLDELFNFYGDSDRTKSRK